jgi:hypothetical protein
VEREKFSLPSQSDMRYRWVHVDLAAIDAAEVRDLVEDAWAFVVRNASPRSTRGSWLSPEPDHSLTHACSAQGPLGTRGGLEVEGRHRETTGTGPAICVGR